MKVDFSAYTIKYIVLDHLGQAYESVFIGDAAETYSTSSTETIFAAYSVGFHDSFDNWSGSVSSGYILPSKASVLCITLVGTIYA